MSSFIAEALAFVRIGRIGHKQALLSVISGLTTVYEACFLVAKVLRCVRLVRTHVMSLPSLSIIRLGVWHLAAREAAARHGWQSHFWLFR